VHLVGFSIGMYYDARTYERQVYRVILTKERTYPPVIRIRRCRSSGGTKFAQILGFLAVIVLSLLSVVIAQKDGRTWSQNKALFLIHKELLTFRR
jgi:hypothetical protein